MPRPSLAEQSFASGKQFRNSCKVCTASPPMGLSFELQNRRKCCYFIPALTVVGTDPTLAMQTRRGTGYYKVPSLRGVWYRGPFEHNGSVATLEDWFEPARLRADYVPTGYKGFDGAARSVQGQRFGLNLSLRDKLALIAFLKTL